MSDHEDTSGSGDETVEQHESTPEAEPKEQSEGEDRGGVIRDSEQGPGGQAE